MTKAVFAFTVVNALAFLAFAFITWDINPANWTEGTRAISVLLGSLFGALGALIAGEIK
jgi:hypothetical protein